MRGGAGWEPDAFEVALVGAPPQIDRAARAVWQALPARARSELGWLWAHRDTG